MSSPAQDSVRFAPSPTGRFHLGNLRTAWVSHLFAWHLDWEWVVRFEDIDRPRVVPGAMERQLADMRTLGLAPDRVLVQSESCARHESLFRAAVAEGQLYPCTCSRREVQDEIRSLASAPHGTPPIYSGRCRDPAQRPPISHPTLAWRCRNPDDPSGALDFVAARTDAAGESFVPAYHWACAIDDYDGRHTLLVRASDLAPALPHQRAVHAWVGRLEAAPQLYPAVFHAALITDAAGGRLEKRTQGVTLPELAEAGTSAEQLLERFRRSFDAAALEGFRPGRIWSEEPDVLRLDAL